jgi:HlyD family secretion protein
MQLKARIQAGIKEFFKDFGDKSPEGKKARKAKVRMIVLGVAAVIAVMYLFGALWRFVEFGRSIKVSGNVEGDEIRISFRVAGLIEELVADEGWVIKPGDILARMDKSPFIKQRDEAASSLKLAKTQYALDSLDYVRAENLFKEGAISAQQRDAAKTKAGNDKAEIERLTAALELSELNLSWTDLNSQMNGYITLKSALQGENVQIAAPVFTAVDMGNLWVTAYLNEDDLGKIKLNQKAFVMTDSYPGKKYKGWISFISQQTEFTPKYIQTTEERVKYVYRIKVRVDNSSLDLKPGMPADAYIMQ